MIMFTVAAAIVIFCAIINGIVHEEFHLKAWSFIFIVWVIMSLLLKEENIELKGKIDSFNTENPTILKAEDTVLGKIN